MRTRASLAVSIAVWLASAPFAALAQDAQHICVPRVGEKLGVRFVEVCATSTKAFSDAERHPEIELPAFWIAATPLPCSRGEHETVACERVTALETGAGGDPGANRTVNALVVDGVSAHRTCALRFGGRLPTPLEREQARQVLALVTLRVRETEPGRVQLDDLPEWVEEGDCAAGPSKPGPGCRISPFPPVVTRPRGSSDVLLACTAAISESGARAVPIGESCGARRDGQRGPECVVGVPGTTAQFELSCEAPPPAQRAPRQAEPELAAFRCAVPASALGRVEPPAQTSGSAGSQR
jgi:hypothetical protein